jgi:Protein of unknown function (DUF3788)
MALSAFDDESHRPEAAEVAAVLDESTALLEGLIASVSASYGLIDQVWNYAGAKIGWSMRLKRGDRIVLYVTPQDGRFLVGVVLGERAANAAQTSGAPESLLTLIEAAPRHREGRGVRMTVKTGDDLSVALMLVALKMAKTELDL